MGNAADNLNARIAEIGAQTARFQSAKGGGHRPGEAQARGRHEPSAVDNLNARIAEIGVEAARIQTASSGMRVDLSARKTAAPARSRTPKIETNPLRRHNGEPIKRR